MYSSRVVVGWFSTLTVGRSYMQLACFRLMRLEMQRPVPRMPYKACCKHHGRGCILLHIMCTERRKIIYSREKMIHWRFISAYHREHLLFYIYGKEKVRMRGKYIEERRVIFSSSSCVYGIKFLIFYIVINKLFMQYVIFRQSCLWVI